jgi:hypothetical protein
MQQKRETIRSIRKYEWNDIRINDNEFVAADLHLAAGVGDRALAVLLALRPLALVHVAVGVADLALPVLRLTTSYQMRCQSLEVRCE